MSEQVSEDGGSAGEAASVVPSQRRPHRAADPGDNPSGDLRKTTAPAVSSIVEDIKTAAGPVESGLTIESPTTDKKRHNVVTKTQASMEEIIQTIKDESKKGVSSPPISQPIPDIVSVDNQSITSNEDTQVKNNRSVEVIELKTLEPAPKDLKEWSDEGECSGSSDPRPRRSESRASQASQSSRISRVVRRWFCCGMPYEAPSEENMVNLRGTSCI